LPVVPEHLRVAIDGEKRTRSLRRTILVYKPRGVLTTRRDPEGRKTIFDLLGDAGRGLVPVGRLDRASSGLLLLTTDTQLANWITDPTNAVMRLYVVTIRGHITPAGLDRLINGIRADGYMMRARAVTVRKASVRESHVTVELGEGRNREVRRLFEAIGHEVTRLKRVRLGGLTLGSLCPGEWRELTWDEIGAAFPGARGRVRL
jgi:pseudouridine synthase